MGYCLCRPLNSTGMRYVGGEPSEGGCCGRIIHTSCVREATRDFENGDTMIIGGLVEDAIRKGCHSQETS